MSPVVRLSKKGLVELIEKIERGEDAIELKKLLAKVEEEEHRRGILVKPKPEMAIEEYLAEKRAQTEIEYGTDLECMICHNKFDHLLSGTCENCWREWMLGVKPKG